MIIVRHGSDAHLPGATGPEPAATRPPRSRMFPDLPAWQGVAGDDAATLAALHDLAAAMREADPADPAGDSPGIPAGFTYLAQFIFHDLTCRRDRPALRLEALYGAGPEAQPWLYERPIRAGPRTRLRIGRTAGGSPNDLPRIGQDALIGDPRNDDNLAVAQTHVAFLKLHNAVDDHLAARGIAAADRLEEARRLVIWHYQWVVLHDFLPRLVDPAVLAELLAGGRRHFRPGPDTGVPVEFAVAAYRMGHAMVRETYDFNDSFPEATLTQLFERAGAGAPARVPIPEAWVIDWKRFFDLGGPRSAANRARRIDPILAPALYHAFPGGGLAYRNLARGYRLGLPTGQAAAAALGLPALPPEEIATGIDGEAAARHGMHERTPLWYYILKEAERRGGPAIGGVIDGGRRLGPLGSRLLAEVLVGFIDADPDSWRNQAPAWRPAGLPAAKPGSFTMADLLRFIGAG